MSSSSSSSSSSGSSSSSSISISIVSIVISCVVLSLAIGGRQTRPISLLQPSGGKVGFGMCRFHDNKLSKHDQS